MIDAIDERKADTGRGRASAPRCWRRWSSRTTSSTRTAWSSASSTCRRASSRDGSAPGADRDPELYYQPSTVAGGRLPHVWVGDAFRKLSTLDLAPYGRFTLLTGTAGQAWAAAAEAVAGELGVDARGRGDRARAGRHRPLLRLGRAARGRRGRRAPGAPRQAHRLAVARPARRSEARRCGSALAAAPGPGGAVRQALRCTRPWPSGSCWRAGCGRARCGAELGRLGRVDGDGHRRTARERCSPTAHRRVSVALDRGRPARAGRARRAGPGGGGDGRRRRARQRRRRLGHRAGQGGRADRPVPIVAVPTTYAGSEATDVWGLTDAGGKRTGVDARVLPATRGLRRRAASSRCRRTGGGVRA